MKREWLIKKIIAQILIIYYIPGTFLGYLTYITLFALTKSVKFLLFPVICWGSQG